MRNSCEEGGGCRWCETKLLDEDEGECEVDRNQSDVEEWYRWNLHGGVLYM